MRIVSFYILILLYNYTFGQNFNYETDYKTLAKQSLDSLSNNYYDKLNQEFITHGEDFSLQKTIALMIGQTVTENYDAYGITDMERSYQIADRFEPDTIIKYAKRFIKMYPTNFSLNYGLWKTYNKKGDSIKAKKFKKRFKLIAESILSTGNGTYKQPYFVTSPIDGQVLIKYYFKKPIVVMGSGRDQHGNFVDILTTIDEGGNKDLYFNIEHCMKRFREELNNIYDNNKDSEKNKN